VQCLTNKMNLITLFVDNMCPDVLCLSEHWLTGQQVNAYHSISNLVLQTAYTCTSFQHGSVAVYVVNKYNTKTVDLSEFCVEMNIELSGVEISEFSLIVVSVYRSTGGNVDIFFNQLDNCLCALRARGKHILLGGDFNIPLNLDSSNAKYFTNILRSHGLFITNLKPTRGLNCLDTAATTLNSWEYLTIVGDPVISDHCPVTMDIELNSSSNLLQAPWEDKYIRLTRVINEDRLLTFKFSLKNVDWDSVIPNKPAESMFEDFFDCFKYNFDLVFPTRTLRPNSISNKKKTRQLLV